MAKCPIPHCPGSFNEKTGHCTLHPRREIQKYFRRLAQEAKRQQQKELKKHRLGNARCSCGHYLDENGDCGNQACQQLTLNAAETEPLSA